jgi:serine/threonine protein kinase
MSDDGFRDPNEETSCRLQAAKETLGASSSHDPPPWEAGDQLNEFVLQKLLGSGSSGFVYRAFDIKTGRCTALKLLKQGSPDDLLRNKLGFRRMMSLVHPNLVRVDRIYQLGSHIALSMEEIDGLTLNRTIQQYKKLDPHLAYARLMELMRDIASGLAMMHSNGYIHRDVKPDNLMVDRDDVGHVIDYGLVDSFDLDQGSFGARGFLVGTPRYFAPEVIWGQKYLPAGDIFSLGIVMLDALRKIQKTSDRRQPGLERSDTNRHDDAERIHEAIKELHDSVPSVIRTACREMLAGHPADRPTAMELSRLGLPHSQRVLWSLEQPIIGRDSELGDIQSWLTGVFDGNVGRLHLTGPSGIGKTRLIQEIVKYIDSKKWGQVFQAQCRVREDQPLQAFDQICDAITNRYLKGDREKIELDPVSSTILQNAFPVLKSVTRCCMQLAPAGTTTERLDALEAVARMTDQLRLVGPLFLIIDDSQWADRDSLNVLDRLQLAGASEGLGIITVSSDSDDPQRVPASKRIRLQSLNCEESVEILSRAASRWSVDVSDSMLQTLAEATDGSPVRLCELGDEFRPGGALAEIDASSGSTVTELVHVDRLWRTRLERLSDDAKLVLPYVVTAGGRVSTKQLGELTGLDDSVDAAVSELARQRLITDEATGGECITIFHDHVADALIDTLSQQAKRKAHHDWASMLSRQDDPQRLAARIAGHFFAADAPGRAVAHAILAAEDAERLVAKTEAAKWYARVIEHVEGKEKVNQLRNAARSYYEADFPVEAADYYQQLARLVDDQERIECQLLAITLLIRSGRFALVRDQLRDLAQTLRLPKPKSPLRSRLSLLVRSCFRSLPGKRPLLRRPATDERAITAPSLSSQEAPAGQAQRSRLQQQRLRLCLSLVRPMSMFDNLYAVELNLAGAMLARAHGDAVQRTYLAVGEAVFGCYDKGHRRDRGEAALRELLSDVDQLGSSRATADYWAGVAFSHALACRWDQVADPVRTAVECYQAVSDSRGFELAHTRWLDLWADWNLGRWDLMQSSSDAMFEDATRRNDLFQQLITSGGFGAAAWLAQDKTDQLDRIRASNEKFVSNQNQTQVFHVFDWISSIQCLLYQAKYPEAWSQYESMVPRLRRVPFAKMQLIRVARQSLGGLVALHNANLAYSPTWIARARKLVGELRREQLGYATVLANLYEGLLQQQIGRFQQSSAALDAASQMLLMARDQARESGLRPFQLAAEDALAEIHTGQSLELLVERMRYQQVVRPAQLARLYTVVTPT